MKKSYPLSTCQRMITNNIHNLMTKTNVCLAKDSSCNKIINAHSIQKSSLCRIAEDHKVYSYVPMSHEQLKEIRLYNKANPRKLSISRVSTFKGFCGRHDNDLFKPIENTPVIPTLDQSVRLMLRTVARHCYDTNQAPEIINAIETGERPKEFQKARDKDKSAAEIEGANFSRKWTQSILTHMLNILYSKSFDQVRTLFLRTDKIPDVMCCGLIPLFHDPHEQNLPGEESGTLKNRKIPLLSITMSSDTLGGYVHFAWLKGSQIIENFIKKLHSYNFDLNRLTKMIFTYLYNFVFRISWWDNLSVIHQKTLMELRSYSIQLMHDSQEFKKRTRPLLEKNQQYHSYSIMDVREF